MFVGLGILAVATLAVLVLAWPAFQAAVRWYVGPPGADLSMTERKDLVQGLASVAQALAVFVAGVVGLIGLYFSWRTLRQTREHTDRQLRQIEQGQITQRFTSAIEQLGSDDLGVRLGGIYALERIAADSLAAEHAPGRDHATITEVLTAYVRRNAPIRPDKTGEGDRGPASSTAARSAPADIQAILTVLGRREAYRVPERYRARLDLYEADLRGANIEGADLREAYLVGADLRGVRFGRVDLRGANLRGANLEGVFLGKADLRGADLVLADLGGAHLGGARLEGVRFGEDDVWIVVANLKGTNLRGADLRAAEGLTRQEIESAESDETTMLPVPGRFLLAAGESLSVDEQER